LAIFRIAAIGLVVKIGKWFAPSGTARLYIYFDLPGTKRIKDEIIPAASDKIAIIDQFAP